MIGQYLPEEVGNEREDTDSDAEWELGHDPHGSPQLRGHQLHHQDKGALKHSGHGEGDDEAEEDEHDVVDGEGRDDTADDLDDDRGEDAGSPAELVTGPAPEQASDKHSTHVTTLKSDD